MWSTFVLQFLSLLWFVSRNAVALLPTVALDLARLLLDKGPRDAAEEKSAVFYEGHVEHARSLPVKNRFKYDVRVCLINLDNPPAWWRTPSNEGETSLRADQVRARCGTAGPVWLLTIPSCCGYSQNPICVYYAYAEDGETLERCVAEVTNTPWGERVVFNFEPEMREPYPKSLHVSPFMDMKNTWRISTEAPTKGKGLRVDIRVGHPEHGNYFFARLSCRQSIWASDRSERANLSTWRRYGYMPQRVAVWIYWQALVLLWKGAPVFQHPDLGSYSRGVERDMRERQPKPALLSWDFGRVPWPFNRG
ncbi:DUF1365 domain-containing protein [Chloropicon roscoffensis]|uniref:DUF1365 domain-containing protein n=1 Tax=Chloropicon roscoffensis TaxID=1461544 RepID=A0A7S3FT75_9CHLO|mmetsp:Transcript_6453/g.19472  ORF Transcript_6453/g.19472 Transcript_6453/m.19472 type:complete len:307 (+) Transcript_6453:433-1353(+)